MTTTTINLPDELHTSTMALAGATGRSLDEVVIDALSQYLAQEDDSAGEEHDITHQDLMREWVARGLVSQEDLDAPDPVTLEEYQRAQTC